MLPNNNNSNNNSSSSSSSMDTSMDTSTSNINKRPAEKQITKEDVNTEENTSNKEVDEPECPICLDPLGTENVKTLNKVKTEQEINGVKKGIEVCGHSFHKKCIDNWINSTREQTGGPRCPVCRTEISRDQWSQELQREPTIVQQADAARPIVRAQAIQNEERELGRPIPFMGILVCLNGQPFRKKYLNSDSNINLRTNNTLGELKQHILNLAPELAAQRTYFCQTNMGKDINNALSVIGLTTPREPSFKITRMYFGTPNRCDNFRELNEELGNINDNTPLIEIYKKYQRNISNALLHLNYSILHNIYNTHIVNDIGSQRGFRDTNYFVNFDNPVIRQEFRAPVRDDLSDYQYERTTRHSLAWLVVNIECNTLTYKVDNNAGSVTNTLQQNPNQQPGGGGQVPLTNSNTNSRGGKIKTRNKHYRHKKSVSKTSGKNKKSLRRRTKQHKKSVRK
jgi:hypothetical protein